MAKATKAQLLGLDIEKTGWVVLMENTNKIERSSDLVTAADTPFIIDKELPGKPVETPFDHSSNKDTIQSRPTNPQQRSKRDTRIPSHLASDYILNQVTSAEGDDPKTAKEALVAADWIDWQRAMDEELKVIKDKDVWEETNLPKGKKAVGVKWVFKKKLNRDSQVDRFAPTSQLSTFRLVLIITAKENLDIAQADVKSAYLNSRLDEEIYMRYPQAVKPKEGCNVLRLKASLYGLKQSGRVWWIQLKEAMIAQGFKSCDFDWGLYVR